jgi:hypothetical protein
VLDSEYTTAMAPGAHIWVAICSDSATDNFFGGVYLAADNLINNPSASGRPNIISASYGYGGVYKLFMLFLRLSHTFVRSLNAADLIRLWRKHQMKSITRLVTAAAVMFAVATLCPAQDVKPTDLGNGAAFNGKKIEMKDKGEVAYLLSFTAGKEFEATTDGLKNTDVHLFVYDSSRAEVAKDDSPGPKCSVKVTPKQDGQYKFVIKNAGGANTVTFNVKVAK